MREMVDGILNGNNVGETGSLDFSVSNVELSLMQGETVTGSFLIRGDSGALISGRVLSTDYRMELLTPDFSGGEAEIAYVFHGEGAEPGEVVKGAFRVISSLGEYSLPYVVTCRERVPLSSVGPVKNLIHFTNLARSDWQEALQLFYSGDFLNVLSERDAQFIPVYRGLSVYPGQEQNLEEFLIHAGKKQAVEFQAETPRISLEIPALEGEHPLLQQDLTIVRNGWGYVVLNVECDGGFLYTDKNLLTEDDFLGNYAQMSLYVDRGALRQGNNHGKVVFYNSFTSFEIDVTVKFGTAHLLNQMECNKKRLIVSLMQRYERFRTKKIGLQEWLGETGLLVEKLIAMDEMDPAASLFKAQLLITQDRRNEAQWLLSAATDLMERQGGREELWAYYLYLTTLISRDENQIRQVASEVESLYRRNPQSWRIAWLLLYLSEEFEKFPAERLRFLEEQFERGCNSFVIYIEALGTYQGNPSLLRKLGPFERQVLYYGIRRDYFSQELSERFLELLEKDREYSPILCRILEKLYERNQDERITQQMCALLVRGGVVGPKALPWYERGMEQQLRITNLYESFMSSLNLEERRGLPKAAVLYFSYQNKLDYEHSAFLYDHVLDNKVLYAEVYDKYLLKCKDFVTQQLGKGRINRHLARLYARMITPEMIKAQNADAFIRLLFASRIRVKDGRIKKVILYTKGSTLGQEYPLASGEACMPIYGNATILFEDAFGNRFGDEIPFETETYMQPDPFLAEILKYNVQAPEFDLYVIDRAGQAPLEGEVAERAVRLCSWSCLDPYWKKDLCLRLTKQFYESGEFERMDEVLAHLDGLQLSLAERMEAARYLTLRGNYDVPRAWTYKYGPYFLDANTLARLTESCIAEDCGEDPVIMASAIYLFHRGKGNTALLGWLGQWAEGTTKELRDIWLEMRANELDVTALEERILVQLMFTGSYVGEKQEIFNDYYHVVGACDVTRAYCIRSSYDYFVREKEADGIIFRVLLEDFKWGIPLQKVCKLAFLKYYALNPTETSREVDEALDVFLREMMAEKIYFGFYRRLRQQRYLLGELSDKVIVEYHTRPGGRARIHYVISREDGQEQEYLSENMRDVFGGICCKEFVLFYGETLQYYVTEEIGGKEAMTATGSLQCPEPESDAAGTKYDKINEMKLSRSLQKHETFDEELESYYFKEFCGESLFVMR